MTLLTFLCQLISTTTFILMCHLILSKRLPRKITYPLLLIHNFYLYFSGPVFRAIWHPDLFTWSDYYFAVS